MSKRLIMLNILHKIIYKKNKNNCIDKYVIEDDILPLQAMIYSINKFK